MRPTPPRRRALRPAALVAILAAATLAAGCRGERSDKPPRQFFPGMDDQPKYTVQARSDFFADGRTMRPIPPGAVAFGRSATLAYGPDESARETSSREIALQRADLLRASPAVYRGVDESGALVDRIPVRELFGLGPDEQIDPDRMRDLVALGRKKFNIFCIACHGGSGRGDGAVGSRWATPIPSLHDPRLQRGGDNGQDGHIFNIIMNGLPNVAGQLPAYRMPPYSPQLNEREAWAVVAYVRSLQRAQSATLNDVPESQRERLMRSRPAPQPAPAPAEEGNQ